MQIPLARLVLNDSRAKLAEAGARIDIKVQELADVTPCPPPKYFREAKHTLEAVLGDDWKKTLSKNDAMKILEAAEYEFKNKVADSIFCHELENLADTEGTEVPEIEDQDYEDTVINWLDKLEKGRLNLLEKITVLHLHLGKVADRDVILPHQEIIEHRFIEEMASLRKCLEVSDKKREHIIRLMSFVSFRMKWLRGTYTKIIKGKVTKCVFVKLLIIYLF